MPTLRTLTVEQIDNVTDDPRLRILLACQIVRRELRAIRRLLAPPPSKEHHMTTINPQDAEELYEAEDGETVGLWTRVTDVAHEARRWMQGHSLILRDPDGAHWALGYDLGLTEEQPHELPWRNGGDPIRLARVYPHTVTKTVYRSTPSEAISV